MIQISDHFTLKKLLQYTFPSIVMLVFTSIYTIVDGFFVSNFAGKAEFTALNFIFPFISMLGSIGFLFGTGGSALIAKTMGEGDHKKANQIFSLIVYVSVAVSVIVALCGIFTIRPLAAALGASGQLLEDSVEYGSILLYALPALILQYEFQIFFPTAGKPQLGLYSTLTAGITNVILDALFVGILPWGLKGAAAATAVSQCVGGVFPLIYFSRKNSSLLKLSGTHLNIKVLVQAATNGSSELLSNISMSLVGMLYNVQLLKYAGENGVAAYGVLMYVNFVFSSIFIGYIVGCAPLFSYHLGAQNWKQLHNLLVKSLTIISVFSLSMFGIALFLARPLTSLFVGYDRDVLDLTVRGFYFFSFSFLFVGFAIFSSGFFTALNNGLVSAIISFLRTLVFQVMAVLLFPLLWQVDGIWLSAVGAEVMAVFVSVIFLIIKRKTYRY